MPLVFSYGSLRQEPVQLATFGRRLDGEPDELVGFTLGRTTHPANVTFDGKADSRVGGMVFEITEAELATADEYERRDAYTRIRAPLASGRTAWVYVEARSAVVVETVSGGPRLEQVRALFREYVDWIGVDLSFQGFDAELAGLPGDYAAPRGTLLAALVGDEAAGCVAIRRWDETTCEMKRLYVRDRFKGRGCGRVLAERAIEWARRTRYERMLLDTLPSMTTAQRLYEELGFRDVAPYRFNPVPGTRYMALRLR